MIGSTGAVELLSTPPQLFQRSSGMGEVERSPACELDPASASLYETHTEMPLEGLDLLRYSARGYLQLLGCRRHGTATADRLEDLDGAQGGHPCHDLRGPIRE